ncbi:MAG: hypothetical protein FWF72_06585, partial [Paludibacter sp.]|nr:hypothetical protein [Paludibacter sp.]
HIFAQNNTYVYRDSSVIEPVYGIGRDDFLQSDGDDPNDLFYIKKQAMYDNLIYQIGDTLYDKIADSYSTVSAITTPLKKISITCDKDYSAAFPQGSDLSVLFDMYYDSPYATIKNGYHSAEGSYHSSLDFTDNSIISIFKSNLAEADYANQPFICYQWICHLLSAPDKTDIYTFSVQVELSNGIILTGAEAVSINLKGK